MRIIYERALVLPLYGAAVSVAALWEHLRTNTGFGSRLDIPTWRRQKHASSFGPVDPSCLSGATWAGGCEARTRTRMRTRTRTRSSVAERRVKTGARVDTPCIRRHSGHLCPAGGPRLQGENRIPLSPVGSGSPQLPWLRRWQPKTPPPPKTPPTSSCFYSSFHHFAPT